MADLVDNCIYKSNPDQLDSDGDHFGDLCDGTSNQMLASAIVPVTGDAQFNQINCEGETILQLANADFISLPKELCQYKVTINQEDLVSLPAAPPAGTELLSAVNFSLLDGVNPVSVFTSPTVATLSQGVVRNIEVGALVIYYWDSQASQGMGEWLKVSDCPNDELVVLDQGDVAQQRQLINCQYYPDNRRVQYAVNFAGLFILTTSK